MQLVALLKDLVKIIRYYRLGFRTNEYESTKKNNATRRYPLFVACY